MDPHCHSPSCWHWLYVARVLDDGPMNVMDARSCAKAFGRAGPGCVATSLRPGALCACFVKIDTPILPFQFRKPLFSEEETNRSALSFDKLLTLTLVRRPRSSASAFSLV